MEGKATRIEWIGSNCRLLTATSAEFERTRPFEGLTIGTGIHLEPKTVALLMTLRAGGGRLVCTGNLNSTQPSTVEFLRAQGIIVFATQTTDPAAHHRTLEAVIAERPDLLLDNGGDLFAIAVERPYANLLGGTEETTSGRTRLLQLRTRLNVPVLVINDSPIKQFAENRHAVGQSLFESYLRFTNRSTNGKRVTVFGYGACGKGTAACFRNAFSIVSVVDIDPVTTLEAHLDGFVTPLREAAFGRYSAHGHRLRRHRHGCRPAAPQGRCDPHEWRSLPARDRRRGFSQPSRCRRHRTLRGRSYRDLPS